MSSSNPRPQCLVTNPVSIDDGTSALTCSPEPCSTGRSASFLPEQLWAEVISSPLSLQARDKVFTLSHNLSLFERLQGNIDMTPARIRQQPLVNPDLYAAYAEHMEARKQWVDAIAQSRQIVRQLNANELNLTTEQLEELKVYLSHRLLEASPYYTQMANLNLLADGHKAWTRTCNVTSLSMALEALGVGPKDFNGDVDRLQRIANTLEIWRYKNDKSGVGAFCYSDVSTMRLPDLLQFVAVYIQCGAEIDKVTGDAFLKKIEQARALAAKKVLTYEMLTKVAGMFGVKCSKPLSLGSFGAEEIGHERKVAQLDKAMQDLYKNIPATMSDGFNQDDKALNEYYKAKGEELEEKSKLENLRKDYSQPGKMQKGAEAYRRKILEKIAPELNRGNQIFLHKPGVVSGHYMKLHDIQPTIVDAIGLYIDDPWEPGKRAQLTWLEAYKLGYFDSYMIMSR